MNKKEYYIKKIQQQIRKKDYSQAKSYYDKSIINIGKDSDIQSYFETIDNELENTNIKSENTKAETIRKRKPIRDGLWITLIIISAIIGSIIYYCVAVYPMKQLEINLSARLYQKVNDKIVYMETEYLQLNGDDFKIIIYNKGIGYRLNSKVLNSHQIEVEDEIINIEFKKDTLIFTPSFTDSSEDSIWSFSENSAPSHAVVGSYIGNGDGNQTSTSKKSETTNASQSNQSASIDIQSNYIINRTQAGNIYNESNHTNSNESSNTFSSNEKSCEYEHQWKSIDTRKIHHDEVGHYQTVTHYGNYDYRYKCCKCGEVFDTQEACEEHLETQNHWNMTYDGQYKYTNSFKQVYVENPYTTEEWIVDEKAYDEIITKYKCSVCGEEKEESYRNYN